MAELSCQTCQYEIATYRAELSIPQDQGIRAAEEGAVRLGCPACGSEAQVPLASLGLVGTMIADQPGGGARRRLVRFGDGAAPPSIEVAANGLRLKFEEVLTQVTLKSICYPSVPLLHELSSAVPVVPHLPVRPEFMALVDLERQTKEVKPPEQPGANCAYKIALKGRPRIETMTVAVLRPEAPLKGISLEVWPRLDVKRWKRHFLRVACDPSTIQSLAAAKRTLSATFQSPDGCAKLQRRDRNWLGTASDRPAWMGIQIDADGSSNALAGGIWLIPQPTKEDYPAQESLHVAIDFGTSNTCIAYSATDPEKKEEEHKVIDFEDLTLRLVTGAPSRILEAPSYWLPEGGYGKQGNILPTELTFYRPREELTPDVIKAAQPIVDFAIPSPGYDVRFNEKEHLLAEFKWASGALGDASVTLQKQYLELSLLFGLAQMAHRGAVPRDGKPIQLDFSYPLAFDEQARKGLLNVFKDVGQRLSRALGDKVIELPASPEMVVNESVAAARAGAGPKSVEEALFIDIGGGSADVALVQLDGDSPPGSDANPWRWDIVTSFKYAGSGFIGQLTKSHCLSQSCSLPVLRRKIRELGTVAPLLRDGAVIPPNMQGPVTNKTWRFYHHLLEFLARALAARILTGAYLKHRSNKPRTQYSVALYSLGNGWGFGPWVNDDFPKIFAKRLSSRVEVIVGEYAKKPKDQLPPALQGTYPYRTSEKPLITVTSTDLNDRQGQRIAAKEAVAKGLLSNKGTDAYSAPEARQSTLVGADLRIRDRGFTAPWYLPVSTAIDLPDGITEPCPKSGIIELPRGDGIAWPIEHFTVPSEQHDMMSHVLADLGGCLPTGVARWLQKSPIEVLLESFWLPSLHKAN